MTAAAAVPRATVDRLTVSFAEHVALEDVSMELPQGAIIGLIGPNGAGKTTLLRSILGTVKPAGGGVSVAGIVGYMPQLGPGAWEFPLSVTDVVLQGSYRRVGYLRRPSRVELGRAADALAAVGMQSFARRQIGRLSGGQRQRILLARALVQDAHLLLLDEPLSGADVAAEAAVVDVLTRLRDDGRTILVSSHDLGWAHRHCDLIGLLARRLIAYGPPDQALTATHLSAAYGGQMLEVGGVRVLAPEGHHEH